MRVRSIVVPLFTILFGVAAGATLAQTIKNDCPAHTIAQQ